MIKKGLCIVFMIIVLVGGAVVAQAQDAVSPEFNPACWKKADCISARAQFQGRVIDELTPTEKKILGDGWAQGASPCEGTEWGKCLPANVTVTEVSIGGKNTFLHIGDYLETVYTYVLGLVGILAAIMFVIAGVQWVTAGGNAETLSSAKHRIVNALIGMFLAYSSYFVLNTINPDLVNLRLPQVYMIRPMDLTPLFCSAAPPSTMFAKASEKNQQSDQPKTPNGLQFNLAFTRSAPSDSGGASEPNMTPAPDEPNQSEDTNQSTQPAAPAQPQPPANSYADSNFECGARFYMQSGGTLTCRGDFCPHGFVCTDVDPPDAKNPFHCVPGIMSGKVAGDVANEAQSGKNIDGDLILYALCSDGSSKFVRGTGVTTDVDNKRSTYFVEGVYDEAVAKCGGADATAGFYLVGDVNDETGGPTGGINSSGLSVLTSLAWGADDWHVIGQTAPGSHDCRINLARVGNAISNEFIQCSDQRTFGGCTADFMSLSSNTNLIGLTRNSKFTSHLISPGELKNGYMCDITINRAEFPAMNAGDSTGRPAGTQTILNSSDDTIPMGP